jgi:hypothetical protein
MVEPLTPGQVAIEMTEDVNATTGEPTLRIDVRSEGVLDATAHDTLQVAIEEASRNSGLRAAATPHQVHLGDLTVPGDCPDCTRGLVSRGGTLYCYQIRDAVQMAPCHPGCVIACGMPG